MTLLALLVTASACFAAPTAEIDISGNGVGIGDGDALPGIADDTDFGNATVGGAPVAHVFTISNPGGGNPVLNLTGSPLVDVTGDTTEFTVTVQPTTPVARGGSTTFTVEFAPSSTGEKNAWLVITNDDATAPIENPYNFAIRGTGVLASAQMQIRGNSVNISNNDFAPSLPDFTDFGGVLATGFFDRVFVITNTGAATLQLTSTPSPVVFGGTDAVRFSLQSGPVTNIAVGSNTSFTVRFTPGSAGFKTGTVIIASNDPDDNPYTYGVQGTGLLSYANIDLYGNNQAITNNDMWPQALDNTYFGSTTGWIDKIFVITNSGNAILQLTGTPFPLVLGGIHATDFALQSGPVTNIAIGSNTSFTMRFTPGAIGERTGTVSIASNDPDDNPYLFAVGGSGISGSEPVIGLYGNATSIGNNDFVPSLGDFTDFGNIATTGYFDRVFVITNSGTDILQLTNTANVIDFGGTHSGDFSMQVGPVTNIAAGSNASFTVRFTPGAAGFRTGTVIIANNDISDNPYTYGIQGTGLLNLPEMAIYGSGNLVSNMDYTPAALNLTDFGSYLTNGTAGVTNTFVITNSGLVNLVLSNSPAVEITGDTTDFTLFLDASTPITPSSTTTFKIAFDPTAVGTRTGIVSIANNDSDENPYVFYISGSGQSSEPEIAIYGLGYLIPDEDSTPSISDGTDYNDVLFSGGYSDHTFSITNTGSANLILGGSPVFGGTNPGDFAIQGGDPVSPVVPGGNSTFVVRFTPLAYGDRTATMSISNNDSDESTYNFMLIGEGKGGHRMLYNAGCNDCHVNHTNATWVARGNEQAARCFSCHNPTGVASNKINIVMHTNSTGVILADCGACHEVHGGPDYYVNMVTTNTHAGGIVLTNLSFIRGDMDKYMGGVAVEPVVFHSTTNFTYTNAPWNGVCQSCHTNTGWNRNNGSNWNHNVGADCTTCHGHDSAFAPPAGGSGCLGCHDKTQGSSPVRRNVASDFTMTSHHAPGGITDADCKVCHWEAWDPDTYHTVAEKYIDLIDPDLGTNAAPISFTNLIRNTLTNVLENTATNVQFNFCLKCHDGNGATATYNTNNTPLRPFSSSTNNVSNIKTFSDVTNKFHHAIQGPGSNVYCTSTTMVAPWNRSGHDKITCFDCHSVNGHGSNTNFNLRTQITAVSDGAGIVTFCTRCHASTSYVSASTGSRFADHNHSKHSQGGGNANTCRACHAGQSDFSGGGINGSAYPQSKIHGGTFIWAGTRSPGISTEHFLFGGRLEGWNPATPECFGGSCNHATGRSY